jgi:hypothetical protein
LATECIDARVVHDGVDIDNAAGERCIHGYARPGRVGRVVQPARVCIAAHERTVVQLSHEHKVMIRTRIAGHRVRHVRYSIV